MRLQGAKRHAAERGELHFPLPVGLLYDDEGNTIIDPDEEVQAAIGDLFKAFVQTGSAYGVVGVFKNRRFPRRAYGGAWAGELRWGRLTHARAVGVLSNPSYAGAYVFGRYRSRRVAQARRHDHDQDGRAAALGVGGRDPGPSRRLHIWEQFLANEQRLAANNNRNGQRPPREGCALCQGILRCGACGGSMTTLHRREGSYYECGHSRADHVNTPGCRSVKATVVDELIARRLLEALAPEEIALALAAADEHADRRARSDRVFELRVERARYEAVRAERAFHACEPDNRLVARSLENRWEQKLRELKDAEAELAEHVVPSSEPSREQIEALARDLPALWAATSTAHRDRKRLLRALIADVTLTSQPEGRELQVGIRWRSGASEQHTIQRPPKPADASAHTLAGGRADPAPGPDHTNAQIADQLNAAGLRTGNGRPFDAPSTSDGSAGATRSPTRPARAATASSPSARSPSGSASHTARSTPGSNRQAHRPPRARQPALHPVPAGGRATMPPAGHELRSPTRRNQNQGCRRCSMKPPSRLWQIEWRRRSWPWSWRRWWSRSSTAAPMGTGRAARHWMRLRYVGSGVLRTRGCWIVTSPGSSTTFRMISSSRR